MASTPQLRAERAKKMKQVKLMNVCLAVIVAFVGVWAAPQAWAESDERPMIWPKLLKPGDTIMFVAPAGELDRKRMKLAKQRLEQRGYRTKSREDLFAHVGYLGGTDERRADELMQAFTDPNVDAIFPGTGGYGTMRIFDLLDYEVIRANPKLFIGFSDITGLHLAFNRHAGLVTFHSPNPMWGLGSEEYMQPFTERYFFQAVELQPSGPAGYVIDTNMSVDPNRLTEGDKDLKMPVPFALGQGKARGKLTGGNLSLVSAMMGTPYELDTRDAILMIEDTREAPYRIDRMLRQLKLAGKLGELRGAVLGQFTKNFDREDADTDDERFSVDGVLRQYFEPLGIPVLMNYPIGHHRMNATLPMGGVVEVDADQGTLKIMPPN